MGSTIDRLQVSYEAIEDRILFVVYTKDEKAFKAFLTRRFLTQFWPPLTGLFQPSDLPLNDGSETTTSSLLQSRFKAHLESASISRDAKSKPQEAKEQVAYPIGEIPMLAHHSIFTSTSSGARTIQIMPEAGTGITFSLHDGLLSPLIQMLYDAHKQADWGLKLKLPGQVKVKEKLPQLLS